MEVQVTNGMRARKVAQNNDFEGDNGMRAHLGEQSGSSFR